METIDTLSSLSRRFRRRTRPASRLHRWGVATAVTIDGATVELALEYVVVLEPTGTGDVSPEEDLETLVSDDVEDEVRRLITTSRLLELPGAGDTADWVERVVVPGARVEQAVVVRADVQLTPELRRLVAGDRAGPT